MERLHYAGAKGNLYLLSGVDAATGASNLTDGQLTWWTAVKVAQAQEAELAAKQGEKNG